jgi:hypothetical protein
MFNRSRVPLLRLLVVFIASWALGQTPPQPTGQPTAPELIKLTGEDEQRAKELDEQIDKIMQADRWDEVIAKAEDLLASRGRVEGAKHFEAASAEWRLKALRRVAQMPEDFPP